MRVSVKSTQKSQHKLTTKIQIPENEHQLVSRAKLLAGCTLKEIGQIFQIEVPETQHHAKGLAGKLAELYLGTSAGNRSAPDFEHLGIELKTVPLTMSGKVCESTFVCSIPLTEISEMQWENSPVYKKLNRVLWVPVEKDRDKPLHARRFGTPMIWSPDEKECEILREDWMELVGLIGTGQIEQITGHLGQVLQVRPKAANRMAQRKALDEDESYFLTLPRGFYLRAKFVQHIFEQHW